MTDEIQHYTTEAPWYSNTEPTNQWDKYIREWEYGDIDHAAGRSGRRSKRYPVVFDIETTGEVPQKPILWTVYDAKTKSADICYKTGYRSVSFDAERVAEVAGERFRERGLYASPISVHPTVSPKQFEYTVLRPAINDPTRVLVGHNVFFDLNIAGKPNGGMLDNDSIRGDWKAATEYKDFTLLSKRAGAFGHIYAIMKHANMDRDHTLNIADTRVVSKSVQIGGSLKKACEEFDIAVDKDVDEHGELTYEYLAYNVGDVCSTHSLYHELRRRLHQDFGADLAPENVFSTASIFKDVLRRMGYDRVHYPKRALKVIAPAYFGGRTEAFKCGELIEDVTYTDILSEYPTVCSLSDVWRFMRAERVEISEINPNQLRLPRRVERISDPDWWAKFADVYVVVRADGQPLPVRTQISVGETTRVYNANVEHANDVTTTHHIYDVVGSWLLSGEYPEIEAAFAVEPVGHQRLKDTNIGGRRIEGRDDVLRRAIEERKAVAREYGDGPREQSLKITANSGYGVAAERLVAGDTSHLGAKKHDIAGTYYNPHVAATITAGGRLMLALGERVAREHGGRVWYCDTDSLIMDDRVVAPVQAAFDPLNPYDGPAGEKDVLEIESEDDHELRGVSLFAVGEKKYAILKDDELIKFTEHGLGHYEQLRDPDVIARFWRSLLDLHDVNVSGEQLTPDESLTPVVFQQPASTENVRESISELIGQEVRFGDWIQQTVDRQPGTSTRFVGTNLNDRALKVCEDGAIEVCEVDADDLKRVWDVCDFWWQSSFVTRANPDVRITGKRTVTKESANVAMDLMARLDAALEAVDLSVLRS